MKKPLLFGQGLCLMPYNESLHINSFAGVDAAGAGRVPALR
jgi:hypothetical protein